MLFTFAHTHTHTACIFEYLLREREWVRERLRCTMQRASFNSFRFRSLSFSLSFQFSCTHFMRVRNAVKQKQCGRFVRSLLLLLDFDRTTRNALHTHTLAIVRTHIWHAYAINALRSAAAAAAVWRLKKTPAICAICCSCSSASANASNTNNCTVVGSAHMLPTQRKTNAAAAAAAAAKLVPHTAA